MADVPITSAPVGRGITPEMPIEVPANIKEMTFSPDPDLIGRGGNTIITDGKGHDIKEVSTEIKEGSKVVEAAKEEVVKPKVEDKTVPEKSKSVLTPPKEEVIPKAKDIPAVPEKKVEPLSLSKPIAPPLPKDHKDKPDEFDYTPYAPQEVTNMKNMSRQSREAYSKLITENKELSKLKDASYLQHEQGYILHPEFQQVRQKDRFVRLEGRAWEQALLDIKAGKPFREINGFDANGNPTFANERVGTDSDEIRIGNNLNLCIQAAQKTGQELQQFPERFKGQISQDLQNLQQERANRFAWVNNPEILKHTIDLEGRGQTSVETIRNEVKSLMPPYLRSNPLAEWVSDLVVALQIRNAELKEATNGKVVAEIKNDEARRGEPSSDIKPSKSTDGERKGIPSVFNLEGMPKY